MKSPGSCSECKQRLMSSTAAFWVVSVAFKSPSGAMRFQPKLLSAGWRPGRWLCQRSVPRRSPVTCSTRGRGTHVPLALSRGVGPPSAMGVSAHEASWCAKGRAGAWEGWASLEQRLLEGQRVHRALLHREVLLPRVGWILFTGPTGIPSRASTTCFSCLSGGETAFAITASAT